MSETTNETVIVERADLNSIYANITNNPLLKHRATYANFIVYDGDYDILGAMVGIRWRVTVDRPAPNSLIVKSAMREIIIQDYAGKKFDVHHKTFIEGV